MALEPILDPLIADLPIAEKARKAAARLMARQDVKLTELRLELRRHKHEAIPLDGAQGLSDHVLNDTIQLWDTIQEAVLEAGEPLSLATEKAQTTLSILSRLASRRWASLVKFVDFVDEGGTARSVPFAPDEYAYLDAHWYLEPSSRFAAENEDRIEAFKLKATKRYKEILQAGEHPSEEDIQRRNAIVKKFIKEKGYKNREALATDLGMTPAAISGIIHSTPIHYSPETKTKFLEKLGIDPCAW